MVRHATVAVTLLVAADGGCGPDTGLGDERQPHADAAAGGASPGLDPDVVLLSPPNGATAVAVNLAAILVAVPEKLVVPGAVGLWRLRPRAGPVVPTGETTIVPCPGPAACYQTPVSEGLMPDTTYVVELAEPLVGETGSSFPPGVVGALTTGAAADTTAPRLTRPSIDVSAGCLSARFSADEPVLGTVVVRAGPDEETLGAGVGRLKFDFAARLSLLPPGTGARAVVRVVDASGNRTESPVVPVRVPPAGPAIAITEVLANPAGPETTQEFVELRNIGADPVALAGFIVEDAGGGDPIEAAELAPGAYALVIGAAYDPANPLDPPARAGTLLLRVPGKIGRDGLGNAGEVVRLKGPDGAVVSSYGGWVNVSASAWNGKSVHRIPTDDACDHPGAWTQEAMPPTPGW